MPFDTEPFRWWAVKTEIDGYEEFTVCHAPDEPEEAIAGPFDTRAEADAAADRAFQLDYILSED